MTNRHHLLSDFIEYPPEEMLARAEENYQHIKRRHSVRRFSKRAVPQAIIEQCLLAAGTAPNGANMQPWHFVAINKPEIKMQIRQAAEAVERGFYAGRGGDEWLEALKPLGTDAEKNYLEEAPWLIAIFTKKRNEEADGNKTNYYVHESTGIATGFLIQALHHAGLATLVHTPKPMHFLADICGRDRSNERPYLLVVVGYPDIDATIPEHAIHKKSLEEISDFI